MNLQRAVIDRLNAAFKKGDVEAFERWSSRAKEVIRLRSAIAETSESGESIKEAVRHELEGTRERDIKFRVGAIASQVSTEVGAPEEEVRQEVERQIVEGDWEVVETANKWMKFE